MKAIPIFLLSMIKFLPCPSWAIITGFNFWQTLLITIPAGIIGVSFFYLSSEYLMERTRRKHIKEMKAGQRKTHKRFSWINKTMVKVKNRFGLAGIAILTPVIFSIPIGSIVMAKFFKHRKLALPALMVSVTLWSILLTFATLKLGISF